MNEFEAHTGQNRFQEIRLRAGQVEGVIKSPLERACAAVRSGGESPPIRFTWDAEAPESRERITQEVTNIAKERGVSIIAQYVPGDPAHNIRESVDVEVRPEIRIQAAE